MSPQYKLVLKLNTSVPAPLLSDKRQPASAKGVAVDNFIREYALSGLAT